MSQSMSNTPTISQIKKQIKTTPIQFLTHNQNGQTLPDFWLNDWLLFVIQKPNSFLFSNPDYQLTDDEYQNYQAGIEQMQAGTPLAYLLGYQEFWSLKFLVNEYTLIPRPDSEVLVEQVLAWIQQNQNSLSKNNQPSTANPTQYKLLDLGTGTGCLAISLAYELDKMLPKTWQVTAVDFCPNALNIAKQNAQLNNITNIQFMQSDWFANIPKPNQENNQENNQKHDKFSVIISNPPYIDKADSHLTALTAEPITALVADNQGLADIEIIINHAPDYLQQGGLLAIEHGFEQDRAVRELLLNQGWQNIHTIKDYGGNERVTMAILSSK
ncbi:peptide chain release factor N(5)-glutamine methyltransferase [Psychrobacter sp. I-STPA10]|uniref:peptide chain release factor N(5)-glutamine methyltransferase n=1 Tax=Psychrobacter sp. I-STPA10 TaxID=2585769 RepID=UPI001E4DCF35|nr:peptide chain release factor N(5)-glutamine methyltransferase [Psychrobacter sp. I-STPA10]